MLKKMLEFIPAALFFVIYLTTRNIFTASAALIIATCCSLATLWLVYRKIDMMVLVVSGTGIFFALLTLIFQSPLFVKVRPTVVNAVLALALLIGQYGFKVILLQKILPQTLHLSSALSEKLNLSWAIIFFAASGLNAYVAFNFEEATWVYFKTLVMPAIMVICTVLTGYFIYRYTTPDENDTPTYHTKKR